jgi:hypothetical protein
LIVRVDLTERVLETDSSLAIELVCDGSQYLGAGAFSPAGKGVDILDIDGHGHSRPAKTVTRASRDGPTIASREGCSIVRTPVLHAIPLRARRCGVVRARSPRLARRYFLSS